MTFIYIESTASTPVDIFADGVAATVNDTQVTAQILDAWSDDEIAALGLARAVVTVPTLDSAAAVLTGEYQALKVQGGWQWVAQSRPLTAAEIAAAHASAERERSEALAGAAQAALVKSDVTVLRCIEAGVSMPVEWATYRKTLRDIISGDSTDAVPTRPDYPAGT